MQKRFFPSDHEIILENRLHSVTPRGAEAQTHSFNEVFFPPAPELWDKLQAQWKSVMNSCKLATQGDARCLYPGVPEGFVSWWLFLSLSESAGVFICIFKYPTGAGEEGAKPESPPWQEAALAQASDAGLDPQATRGNARMDLGRGWGCLSYGAGDFRPLAGKVKGSFPCVLGRGLVGSIPRAPVISSSL